METCWNIYNMSNSTTFKFLLDFCLLPCAPIMHTEQLQAHNSSDQQYKQATNNSRYQSDTALHIFTKFNYLNSFLHYQEKDSNQMRVIQQED